MWACEQAMWGRLCAGSFFSFISRRRFCHFVLSVVALIGIWGNFPCLFYMFTNTTLNRLGFGMSTVGTAVLDCICCLVPVAIDSSVFIQSNIVWNRWKSTLKARSIRVSEPRNGNINTVYFIHEGKYSNQSHGDSLFSMNEHAIANVCL